MSDDSAQEGAERPAIGLEISIKSMWRVLGEINEWNRANDFKASVVLAADGVILVAMAALSVGGSSVLTESLTRHLAAGICVLLTLVAVIISSAFASLCLVPYLREGEVTSLLFPDYIAQQFPNARSYEDAVRTTLGDAESNLREVSHQVWTASRVFKKKTTYVTWGIRILILALALLLVDLLLAV